MRMGENLAVCWTWTFFCVIHGVREEKSAVSTFEMNITLKFESIISFMRDSKTSRLIYRDCCSTMVDEEQRQRQKINSN